MGQYLGGVVNVVVGAYTGNWWEISAGVMQIVGTKENNPDLQTAGAVVGAVALVGGAMTSSAPTEGSTATAGSVSDTSQAADLTATNMGGSAAATPSTALPDTLKITPSAPAATSAAPASLNVAPSAAAQDVGNTLSTYDKISKVLSTPAGIGVMGGIGNAYGNIYAAQKQTEAQLAMQQQQLALERQKMALANTVGTGVITPSTPAATGLLGSVSTPNVASAPLPTTAIQTTPAGLTV